MADLGTLKSRIANEIHRTDLTSDIAYAISDAIKFYQNKRFAFNQTRANFNTVAGTEFYTPFTDIGQIDSIVITVNQRKVQLEEWPYLALEEISTTTNTQSQPWSWAWYGEQIRLYPIPDQAYALTISYLKRIDEPATDGTSNEWTEDAEDLIRASAKMRLYRDVLHDDENGIRAASAETTALRRLLRDSRQLVTGGLRGSW